MVIKIDVYLSIIKNREMRNSENMTFIEVLESEFYYLIEAIEHGSSDSEVIENYKKELFNKTGYNYL